MNYVYLLSGDERERELARAEAAALADAAPCSDKLVRTERPIDMPRTAYVIAGVELLASGGGLGEVRRKVADLKITSDGFGMAVRKIPARLKVNRREVADALAWEIGGRPDLDHPRERFLAFVTAEGLWFGRALEPGEPDWRRFVQRPHGFSSALPSQAARAVCNLVVREGDRVVDPCCGSGTLLLNAVALGASITGFDINPRMVGATNGNLEHFGYPRAASLGDATEVGGAFDVALANVPYGRMTPVTEAQSRKMIAHIVTLAPRGVLIAARDIAAEVGGAGAEVVGEIGLGKRRFTRRMIVWRRDAGT